MNVDCADEAELYQEALKDKTGMSTVPNVFIKGDHIGGCDDTFKKHQQIGLLNVIKGPNAMDGTSTKSSYDYDLIVIGGGSGGLAASKVRVYLFRRYERMCYYILYKIQIMNFIIDFFRKQQNLEGKLLSVIL